MFRARAVSRARDPALFDIRAPTLTLRRPSSIAWRIAEKFDPRPEAKTPMFTLCGVPNPHVFFLMNLPMISLKINVMTMTSGYREITGSRMSSDVRWRVTILAAAPIGSVSFRGMCPYARFSTTGFPSDSK